jgi:hypothetical protein
VKNSAWYLAPVIVLIAGLSLARGQMVETDVSRAPWWLRAVAQAPVTMPLSETSAVSPSAPAAYPPSGVLPAPPPAPVAVPSSGVLQPPPERRTITTIPVKIASLPWSAETAAATPATRHLRRTAARGATRQKHEDVARGVASRKVTERRYYNYVAPVVASRPNARTVVASRVPVRSGAPLVDTAIAAGPTTPMPIYRYVYETDRILVVDPHTGIVVQAIPR